MVKKSTKRETTKAWLATPKGRASRMWTTLCERAGKVRYYEHVQVRMTRDEFLRWAVPAIRRWWSRHPGETPTVDRKDSQGHYELGNLRITSRGENTRNRSYNKNLVAPEGMAWCGGKCQRYLPIEAFSTRPSRSVGVQGRCKKCHAEYVKARRKTKGRASQAKYLRDWRKRKLKEDPLYFQKRGRR